MKGVFLATLTAVNSIYSWRDMWGRPFRYSLSGGKPLVESLGRDGVRGGVRLDTDISNRVPHPAEDHLPLLQKLTHPWARGMIVVALICGVLAGTLVFYDLSNEKVRPQSWMGLAMFLFVTFGVATLGALTITASHIPSGH